jgi:hypothetical protein
VTCRPSVSCGASQLVGNFVNRQRLAEIVALNVVTLMCLEECQLRFVFDAFGNHLKVQLFAMLMIAVVIAASSGFAAISRINDRSILSLPIGKCFK